MDITIIEKLYYCEPSLFQWTSLSETKVHVLSRKSSSRKK